MATEQINCAQLHGRADVKGMVDLPFLTGFYFAFRLFIMLLSVRLLGMEPQAGVEVSFAINIAFLVLALFSSPANPVLPARQILRLPSVKWALLFLGFSACSLLWTSAPSMSAAIGYWFGMAADVAIVFLLLRMDSPSRVVPSLMQGFVWGTCAIALIAWMLPTQSDLRLGDEELLGPNQIGYLCGFGFFIAQYLERIKKGIWTIASLLLVVTLLRTLSKTTIAALLIAGLFLLLRDRGVSRKSRLWIGFITLVVVAFFWSLIVSYADVYASAGNQSETLSGRFSIWAIIFAEAIQQPWIGHGFHSVWKVIPPIGPDQFEARHAHNELLQQFYAYGVVGILLFIGVYGSFYRCLRRLPPGSIKTFFYSLLLFVLIRGFADTEAFDLSLPLWAIVSFSVVIEKSLNEFAPPANQRVDLKRSETIGVSELS